MHPIAAANQRFAKFGISAPNQTRQRTLTAFLCALGIVVAGAVTIATDVRSVLAFNEEGSAAFFRNDRARHQAAAPARSIPATAAPSPVQSLFGGRQLTVTVPANGQSTAGEKPRAPRTANGNPAGREKQKTAGEFATSSGSRSICVSLCDGYHFPVGSAPAAGGVAAHEATCNAVCPDAPTRLYFLPAGTDDINQAHSARGGRPYTALPVALRHADKRDNTCTCRRYSAPQMSMVSLYRDFTLRSGDAVMTQSGFRVFRGANKFPYKANDFAALNSSSLGRAERTLLQRIEKASVPFNASPRERPASPPRTTSTPIPALGPFLVSRPTQRVDLSTGARTAQAGHSGNPIP
jgi:hypothetical protein